MSRSYISRELRERISFQARRRCGYCLSAEEIVGTPMQMDHIIPETCGGPTTEDNLWLACTLCNEIKSDRTAGVDEFTGEVVPFFNPRLQEWIEHFEWSVDGTEIIGKSDTGRVTVSALRLNRDSLVAARKKWVASGWHPPRD